MKREPRPHTVLTAVRFRTSKILLAAQFCVLSVIASCLQYIIFSCAVLSFLLKREQTCLALTNCVTESIMKSTVEFIAQNWNGRFYFSNYAP